MHKWSKDIAELIKSKVSARGIDNIQRQELDELKEWSEFTANMAKTEYYYKVIEAMDKSGEKEPDKNYYNDPSVRMYRDMDASSGRMYYSDGNSGRNYGGSNNSRGYDNSGHNDRGYTESRYERARRGYEDSKQMNPNADNMQAIEKIFDTFKEDIKEFLPKMTPNEKSIARNKLTDMSNMMM